MKYGKATPDDRVFIEPLKVIWNNADIAQYLTCLINNMYNRGQIPQAWSVSDTAQIGKNNGKEGCKAIRLINILCPMGKAIASAIWSAATPDPYAFSYGFKARKRRVRDPCP